ncbi:MAG: AMP-binding protein [Pseudomonadota bacterium]
MDERYVVDESRVWFRQKSGWPDEVPKNLEFPKKTLGEMLDESVRKYGSQPAMWFLDRWMTYDELGRNVNALATALHNLGIRKGDVVSLLLPNSFQYVISYYACMKLGAIVSGINPTYKPGEALHQIKTVGARALIVLDALYPQIIQPVEKEAGFELVISTNIGDFLPTVKRVLGKLLRKIPTGAVPAGAHALVTLLKTSPAPPRVEFDPEEDTAVYIMTGGTTGVPKAAVLTHFNCVSNVLQCRAWLYKAEPGAAQVAILPFFHSFGMTAVMNLGLSIGAWLMLFPKPPSMEELSQRVETIAPSEATFFCGAEVLFQKMADYLEANPGKHKIDNKLTMCISGAGPLHRHVLEKFERITNGRLGEGYGLTESTPVVSACPFYGNRNVGTIGLPFPGTEWRIMDMETATRELPPGENNIGEICVAGPQVMKGYLNRELETAETIKRFPDGKLYLLTGDLGFMDETGQITIRDRKKQLIKYKGYSVYPKEVEELVAVHPKVYEVAVHGLPDREAGEVIKAWCVLEAGAKGTLTEAELLAWCKENMTHYKVPRHVEFIDELPKTAVGKVLRRELAEADPIYKAYHAAEG